MVIIAFLLLFFSLPARAGGTPIGVYLSMTGPAAAWGQSEWKGIKTAHQLEPFFRKSKVKLILEDNASRPEDAALSAERLIDKGVKAIIGPVTTTNALSGLAVTEKYHIVDIIPSANGLQLTDNKKYAARICFTDDIQAKIMAQYIVPIYKKGIIIEDISQNYSIDLTHFFNSEFKKYGGKIIKIYQINSGDTDFSALITRIIRLKPDFIYLASYYRETALFARELRELGGKIPLFSGSAASTNALIKIGGKAVEGLTFTDDYDPTITITKLGRRFVKLFKKRYGRFPDSAEALAADSYFYLIAKADKTGFNPDKLGHAVRNGKFKGASGIINIRNGKTYRTVVIRTVKNGKFIPIALFSP